MNTKSIKNIFFKIVFPAILIVFVFVFSMFFIIIPIMEKQMINGKKEMIKELTNTNWSILKKYENDVEKGLLTIDEAQKRAISEIEVIRYGDENMDYFWISDMRPNMIMHPYRKDLVGKDISNLEDPTGKKMFAEFVEVAEKSGFGYVDYMWQWKDDSTHIVPKLSYVKLYEPWGWIIGTGIYIEDVKQEIKALKGNVVKISIIIFIVFLLLFSIIIWQSLEIEKQRATAEEDLLASREKYKTLVEASIEGSLMILENKIIYSNQIIQDLLGFSDEEFKSQQITDIIPEFNSIKTKNHIETYIFTKTKKKIDVAVYISEFQINEKTGLTLIINDLRKESLIREELVEKKERLKNITGNFDIGIFRATYDKKSKIIEANKAAINIFGVDKEFDLYNKNIFDLFFDDKEKHEFLRDLNLNKSLKNRVIKIANEDGSFRLVSVSVVLTKNAENEYAFVEGLIDDVSYFGTKEEQQKNLIKELQTAQFFVNQPIKLFYEQIPVCKIGESIKLASALMQKNNSSAVFVTTDNKKILGIITFSDLNNRVLVPELHLNTDVSEIMSAPIVSINEKSFVFEAIFKMDEHKIRYLAVKNSSNEIIGVISQEIISQLQFKSYSFLLKNVNIAKNVDDLIKIHKRLPVLIKALIDSGIDSKNITRIMSKISDSIVTRLIDFGIEKIGEPPTEFAFIVMGSEGRHEQTLKTDQDNAIIYKLSENSNEEKIKEYFLKLGKYVNDNLNEIGYKYCNGEVMAMNPKWTNSLKTWKGYFKKWISEAEPKALLELSIFFDFRLVFGDKKIVEDLKNSIAESTENNPPFFIFMAENILTFKPPLNFFGNIVVEDIAFNIKEVMMFCSGFARIYALKNNINATNTLSRVEIAYKNNQIIEKLFVEFRDDYSYLMQLRLKHQSQMISENKEPDNLINPKKLTGIEITQIKNILRRISNLRTQLNADFKGIA